MPITTAVATEITCLRIVQTPVVPFGDGYPQHPPLCSCCSDWLATALIGKWQTNRGEVLRRRLKLSRVEVDTEHVDSLESGCGGEQAGKGPNLTQVSSAFCGSVRPEAACLFLCCIIQLCSWSK